MALATKLFLLLILLFHVTSSLSEGCHPQDKKALLQIKKELNNPTLLSSWNPHTNCCDDSSWYGVICAPSSNRVYSLLFEGNDELSSTFPPSIGNLPTLEHILLYKLPNLIGSIPRSITKLANLKSLTISETGISGAIPNYIAKLKSLTFLDLSENHLSGKLPPNLFHLANFEAVYLHNNKLTGPIPSSLAKLNSSVVDLSHNRFEGDASVFFGFAKKTETIDLSWNMLAFDMGRLEFSKTLKHLDVSHNRVYGKLPEGVTNLEWLEVSYNRLCGEIPKGGIVQAMGRKSYSHNKCLCGSPLPSCKKYM